MDKKTYLSIYGSLCHCRSFLVVALLTAPIAIGAKSNIPVPAIVLGAICGVFAFGILGLILGPVTFAILITVWRDTTGTDHLV